MAKRREIFALLSVASVVAMLQKNLEMAMRQAEKSILSSLFRRMAAEFCVEITFIGMGQQRFPVFSPWGSFSPFITQSCQ